MNMGCLFIAVYNKGYHIIFTEFATKKIVHVSCPEFNFRHPLQMCIDTIMFNILNVFIGISKIETHLLFSKSQFMQHVVRTADYEVSRSPVSRFCQSFVRVIQSKFFQTCHYEFWNTHCFVDGLNLPTLYYFKI